MLWIFVVALAVICLPQRWLVSLNIGFHKGKSIQVHPVYQYESLIFDLKSGEIGEFPNRPFKYYGDILQKVVEIFKKTGELNLASLDHLQKGLSSDFKFELKLKELKRTSVSQFILTSLFIWVFVWGTQYTLKSELPTWCFLSIITLQLLGFVFYFMLTRVVLNRVFGTSEQLIESIIYFRNLYRTSMDINEILSESRILIQREEKLPFHFNLLHNRVKKLVNDWKHTGENVNTELDLYESRMNYLREEQFEKLLKSTKVLQFLTLCLFFLPSYFVLILSLFSSFLIE